MKVACAVVVAFVFLLVGWGFWGLCFEGVYYVASHAREGTGLIHYLHIYLKWILCPLYGGFLATYITSRIFKEIGATTIATGFISVVVTLAVVVSLLMFLQAETYYSSISDIVVVVIQNAVIIVGAKIGNIPHEKFNA